MDIGKEVKEVEFIPLETETPAPVEPAQPSVPVTVPEEEPAGV
jgi:hypothetical protein